MERKIVRDRNKELTIDPLFGSKEVVFYRLPRNIKFAEGELWEFSLGNKRDTGRKDKRGVPIFTIELIPVRRVEDPRYMRATYADGFFYVPVYSGDVKVGEIKIPARQRYEVFDLAERSTVSLYADMCIDGKVLKSEKIWAKSITDIHISDLPERIQLEITTILERINISATSNDMKKIELTPKENSINDYDIFYYFLKGDYSITHNCMFPDDFDPREPYGGHEGCIYRIGDLEYALDIVFCDEDYVEYADRIETNMGEISGYRLEVLRDLAYYISNPNASILFALGLPKNENNLLYNTMTCYTGKHEPNYAIRDEALQRYAQEAEKWNGQREVTYNFYDMLKITYTYTVTTEIKDVENTEWGIGAKDNTCWTSYEVQFRVVEKCNIKIEYKEGFERIAKILEEALNK